MFVVEGTLLFPADFTDLADDYVKKTARSVKSAGKIKYSIICNYQKEENKKSQRKKITPTRL